jgi:hypothetical protein
VASAAIALAVACSFPAVPFAPDEQFVDGAFVGPEGAVPLPDASDSSSGTVSEGGTGSVDGNTCIGDPACDCDGDQDKKPECGGHDCNDFEARVHSGVTAFIADPAGPSDGGDWNCDRKVEREYDSGLQCSDVLDGSALLTPETVKAACDNAFGFTTEVECAATGTFIQCQRPSYGAKECNAVNAAGEQRVRGCR